MKEQKDTSPNEISKDLLDFWTKHPETNQKRIVFSIGYEERTVNEFLEVMTRFKIKAIADIRDIAYSQDKNFNGRTISRILAKHGIIYVHLPQLGAPPYLRNELKKYNSYEIFFQEFLKKLKQNLEIKIAPLIDLISKGFTCIMCYERKWNLCHRRVICNVLEEKGYRSIHL